VRWQDENEEMGKEVAEGKVHSLERQVALAKSFAQDVGAKYVELEDHLHALDQENEGLHQQVTPSDHRLIWTKPFPTTSPGGHKWWSRSFALD